jgi:sarcosine oxidase subunit gamma
VVEPRSPLAGALAPKVAGEGAVRISERRCDLVQLAARAGRGPDVAAAIQAAFAVALPGPGHAAAAPALTALWIQPDAWMLLAPRGAEGALARAVKAAVGEAGSVVDQSHGRAVIGLAGAHAPRVLASLCRIDLHPRSFGPGRVAVTPLAGLSGILHQRDAVPSYDLIVFATLSRWFAAALLHAAEETGHGSD